MDTMPLSFRDFFGICYCLVVFFIALSGLEESMNIVPESIGERFFFVLRIERRSLGIPPDKAHPVSLEPLMLEQPIERFVCFEGGQGTDCCGASVFNKTAFITKGKCIVFGGDQPAGSGNARMLFHDS